MACGILLRARRGGAGSAGAEDCAAQIAAWNRERGVEEPRTLLLQADVGSEEAITKMFADYFAHWPRLDVCIPNAGTQTGCDSHASCGDRAGCEVLRSLAAENTALEPTRRSLDAIP